MNIKTVDEHITQNYNVVCRLDGVEFSENYAGGYVYIIQMESGNAYRVFLANNELGLQCLMCHYFVNGVHNGYDDAADYKWLAPKYTGTVFDECITLVDNMDGFNEIFDKWVNECELDGLFTETINE